MRLVAAREARRAATTLLALATAEEWAALTLRTSATAQNREAVVDEAEAVVAEARRVAA